MKNWPFHGFREAACVVKGVPVNLPLKNLLDTIFLHQPRMTGWPPWVDTRSSSVEANRPYIKESGWEALIYNGRPYWSVGELDFWRIEPTGRFYSARTHEDDTSRMLLEREVKPGTLFDFLLLISRTAELVGTVRAFVDALGINREKASVEFAFRWTGLKGRKICSWVDHGRELYSFVTAEDDKVISSATVAQETPNNVIWEVVKQVTQPVFDIFGAGVGDSVFEDIVNRTLNRQL
jgi:hypothetical protein